MRKSPPPRVNVKRRAAAFQRAYGGEERAAWVRAQPCVVCGIHPSQNAHVKSGGAGRKSDAQWVVPLCDICHQSLHLFGQKTFEAKHKTDLAHAAAVTDARWEQHYAITHPEPNA